MFNEITKQGILDGIAHPGEINVNRVDAQQSRRILDRLVGYQVSPLLWRPLKYGLSAGRVQTVALRLVCEREKEIEEFVSEEWWSLDGNFQVYDGTKVVGDIFPGNVAIANPSVYDWYVSAHASDEEREAGLAFLAFINTPAELEAFMLAEGGSAPMITYSQSFVNELAQNRLASDFATIVNESTTYVPFLHEVLSGAAMDAFLATIPFLYNGSMTPEEFCDALTVAANE